MNAALRMANIARQKEWGSPTIHWGLNFRANELLGEAGEVCNVIKKIERERMGAPGSRATLTDLERELADVMICIDLAALELGIPPIRGIVLPQYPDGSYGFAGLMMGVAIGQICSAIGEGDIREWLPEALAMLTTTTARVAKIAGINLEEAVVSKFNETSEVLGFETRLSL